MDKNSKETPYEMNECLYEMDVMIVGLESLSSLGSHAFLLLSSLSLLSPLHTQRSGCLFLLFPLFHISTFVLLLPLPPHPSFLLPLLLFFCRHLPLSHPAPHTHSLLPWRIFFHPCHTLLLLNPFLFTHPPCPPLLTSSPQNLIPLPSPYITPSSIPSLLPLSSNSFSSTLIPSYFHPFNKLIHNTPWQASFPQKRIKKTGTIQVVPTAAATTTTATKDTNKVDLAQQARAETTSVPTTVLRTPSLTTLTTMEPTTGPFTSRPRNSN